MKFMLVSKFADLLAVHGEMIRKTFPQAKFHFVIVGEEPADLGALFPSDIVTLTNDSSDAAALAQEWSPEVFMTGSLFAPSLIQRAKEKGLSLCEAFHEDEDPQPRGSMLALQLPSNVIKVLVTADISVTPYEEKEFNFVVQKTGGVPAFSKMLDQLRCLVC